MAVRACAAGGLAPGALPSAGAGASAWATKSPSAASVGAARRIRMGRGWWSVGRARSTSAARASRRRDAAHGGIVYAFPMHGAPASAAPRRPAGPATVGIGSPSPRSASPGSSVAGSSRPRMPSQKHGSTQGEVFAAIRPYNRKRGGVHPGGWSISLEVNMVIGGIACRPNVWMGSRQDNTRTHPSLTRAVSPPWRPSSSARCSRPRPPGMIRARARRVRPGRRRPLLARRPHLQDPHRAGAGGPRVPWSVLIAARGTWCHARALRQRGDPGGRAVRRRDRGTDRRRTGRRAASDLSALSGTSAGSFYPSRRRISACTSGGSERRYSSGSRRSSSTDSASASCSRSRPARRCSGGRPARRCSGGRPARRCSAGVLGQNLLGGQARHALLRGERGEELLHHLVVAFHVLHAHPGLLRIPRAPPRTRALPA